MKRVIALSLGLFFLFGTVSFAQSQLSDRVNQSAKKKKGHRKGGPRPGQVPKS